MSEASTQARIAGGAPLGQAGPAGFAASDLLFAGGGEVGALMRAMDWATTPLGPAQLWPQSLRTMVSTCLNSRFPILVWWGPELAMFYNDAYVALIRGKHPHALGAPGRAVFPEIWDIIGPMLGGVLTRGEATWSEDRLLLLERRGFPEECYFTFSYSPIRAENGDIGGVFTAVTETTARVLGERRLATLRALAERAAVAHALPDAARGALEILAASEADLPCALLYLLEGDADALRLAGSTHLPAGTPLSPHVVPLDGDAAGDGGVARALAAAVRTAQVQLLDATVAAAAGAAWPAAAGAALALPVARRGQERPHGVLLAGLGRRLALDDAYVGFLQLVASQVATALDNAEAYEAERRRAEALAELDRAKTAFFSNISHEFRTPLTLLLGPTEDALADPGATGPNRERLQLIHRNALRLQRLVNTLLEFSRIEAGRIDAAFEPTDLGGYTGDLTSGFRSAVEKAGLQLVMDCPPVGEPVWVDREMWEKVVLNLLSNALKHTFHGRIAVALRDEGSHVALEVSDTGVGIPAEQLPRLFDRFHRIPNARARSHEGTGIGLALVQELVRLHGGSVEVRSELGAGSTFTVRIPRGSAHLPPEQIRSREHAPAARAMAPYVEEALRWLPEPAASPPPAPAPAVGEGVRGAARTRPARILVADDNADMREYVARLLRGQSWEVEALGDGRAALDAARAAPPDLVLADVMMPGLDGFALLRALRATPETSLVPVILLSARAGEESRIEGLDAGADDYLVKPFSARELVARISAHLGVTAARARAAAEVAAAHAALQTAHARLQEQAAATQQALADAEDARRAAEAANRAKSQFLAAMSHDLRTPLNAIAGYAQLLDLGVHGPITDGQREALARITRSQQHLLALIDDVLNFAKLEAGRLAYAIEDVALADAVLAVRHMVEPQMQAKALEFSVQLPPHAAVRADSEKLRQILLNLLSNAVKFTNAGGRITVDLGQRAGAPAGFVFLRVSDTGIGIARGQQDAIFEPFVQVDGGPTRITEGTGLGLAISRDLARGMHGSLRVRSQEGIGSTFTLALPEAQPTGTAPGAEGRGAAA